MGKVDKVRKLKKGKSSDIVIIIEEIIKSESQSLVN